MHKASKETIRDFLPKIAARYNALSHHASTMAVIEQETGLIESKLTDLRNRSMLLTERLSKSNQFLRADHKGTMASFQNPLGGLLYYLIQIPTIILTLLVTVAAGGLGSIVSFTRKFLTGYSGANLGRLFVNVGEGVAAALAIFLFSSTGMLMLTQGAAGTTEQVELSPYMVAFIAFVSGFMAEDAFLRIQRAGKKIFQTPSEDTLPGPKPSSDEASPNKPIPDENSPSERRSNSSDNNLADSQPTVGQAPPTKSEHSPKD